ncbi:MAG: ABC-F family ATP-binding cassette domain-containing protein [Puniceicoccales bacterium]|jgi:ATP-binding cassette subfamily F protein 3|nr:ABC-F family ATP-binding cassette domain-containing protein [Puniceicoccales bacterium]
MISCREIAYAIGKRTLWENATFTIPQGARVGVVGHNGCGKTTFFCLLKGELPLDAGRIERPKQLRIQSVEQEIGDQSRALLDFVLSADGEWKALSTALDEEEDADKIAEICDRLQMIDGYRAESRASEILHGLGFSQEEITKPLSAFSGGWQMRVALAATLFAPSELLLLDEPTNHLDLETTLWLEQHLAKASQTLLLISHDRHFLNRLCTHILHIHRGEMRFYSGNYDTFELTRRTQEAAQGRAREKQEKRREHLQSFVDRFRYKASKAKQAQSRLKMLARMEAIPPPLPDAATAFSFPSPADIDRVLLKLRGGSVGYDSELVLKNLELRIDQGDRIGVLGANGQGKSTLTRLLAGKLELQDGQLELAKGLKVAYFSQQLAEILPLQQTPIGAMTAVLSGYPETQIRSQLARFGLTQDKAETRIERLSGGEKTRLLLALITRDAPHLLLLDEPTNHLDIDSKEALIRALQDYNGAVVLVAHDFFTLEAVCDQLWLIEHGQCRRYDGDLEDYRQSLFQKKSPSASPKPTTPSHQPRAEELAELERQMESLRAQQAELAEQLAKNGETKTQAEWERQGELLEKLEERWLAMADAVGDSEKS